jgi:hypothetical protein
VSISTLPQHVVPGVTAYSEPRHCDCLLVEYAHGELTVTRPPAVASSTPLAGSVYVNPSVATNSEVAKKPSPRPHRLSSVDLEKNRPDVECVSGMPVSMNCSTLTPMPDPCAAAGVTITPVSPNDAPTTDNTDRTHVCRPNERTMLLSPGGRGSSPRLVPL